MSGIPAVQFVLPAPGGSGGANSVVQEAMGLSSLGVRCGISVDGKNAPYFADSYPELASTSVKISSFVIPADLANAVADCGVTVLVATTNNSMQTIHDAHLSMAPGVRDKVRLAYYVQDYEPLFFEPDTALWKVAYDSYTLNRQAMLFAKTDWLRRIVSENHGVDVRKVSPSIDQSIYFPDLRRTGEPISILAMVRPKTPRRAPRRTMRVLNSIAGLSGGTDVRLRVFGASNDDLHAARLPVGDPIENLGRLRRTEVPDLLRQSDLFLDLSDFQAFGRTGLEAMACGCIPIVPILGGTAEYAIHGRNAYVVDTRSDEEVLAAIQSYISLSASQKISLRLAALETAAEFSILKASMSELRLFAELVER